MVASAVITAVASTGGTGLLEPMNDAVMQAEVSKIATDLKQIFAKAVKLK